MIAMSILVLAASASLAKPDGTKLRPITQCFAITKDGAAVGATWQRVTAVRVGGRAMWDIVIHQKVAAFNFDMRDHFVIDRRDLRPVAFDSMKGGKPHIVLNYADGRVTGTRTEESGVKPIDMGLEAPVWEGNLWGITFGALPLAADARFELPFYQYDKGLGSFKLEVTGSEDIETPAGKAAAWTVKVGDDPAKSVTYLIDKKTGDELGTRAGAFGTRLGGDCSGLG